VEGFSVEVGSCGVVVSFDAIVLHASARKTHGRATATPSRKRWSASNQEVLDKYCSDMLDSCCAPRMERLDIISCLPGKKGKKVKARECERK
jgi:hypothetical protein